MGCIVCNLILYCPEDLTNLKPHKFTEEGWKYIESEIANDLAVRHPRILKEANRIAAKRRKERKEVN